MSRSGYSSCLDQWELIRWRGAVASATRGRRGQKLLRDLLAALDAMPEKRLIGEDLVDENGEVCALGALGQARGIDMTLLDSEEHEEMADIFDVSGALIREIEAENDECWGHTPEMRWSWMRKWVAKQIKEETAV